MSCQCSTLQVPNMHVSKTLSLARRYWYIQYKHPALSGQIGTNQSETVLISYSTANFLAFLNEVINSGTRHLRIYFAADLGYLSLVYAIENTTGTGDKELYYLVYNNSYSRNIGTAQALSLITAYQSVKLPILNSIYNHPATADTTCITHKISDIQGLVAEMGCQNPASVRAYFASYMNKDTAAPDAAYYNKLFVEFVFTEIKADGSEQDFYIDDCDEFRSRPKPPVTLMEDFNNGGLCPPCINCTDVLILPPECAKTK